MKILFTIILTFMLASPLYAQSLTEVERLKIQVLNLQIQLKTEQAKTAQITVAYGQCSAQLLQDSSKLTKEISDLQKEIEKNHIGFSFDITTGKFTKLPVNKE